MARIEELLEELENILGAGKAKAFSGKVVVDAEAMKTVIEDIRLTAPEEIKQATILASERREIMNRATKDAENILETAKIKSRELLEAVEKRAVETDSDTIRRSEELMRDAQQKAKGIIDAAKEEAAVLTSQESVLEEAKKAADDLVSQAEGVLEEAKEKAAEMIKLAMDNATAMEAEATEKAAQILGAATENAEKLETEAEQNARDKMEAAAKWSYELKAGASTYVDEIVNQAGFRLSKSLSEIQALQSNLKEASKVAFQEPNRPTK